jgi:prolyl-tRNA synthetase
MNRRFKETEVCDAYFPMLIPEFFFQKEKDHIVGFLENSCITIGKGTRLKTIGNCF